MFHSRLIHLITPLTSFLFIGAINVYNPNNELVYVIDYNPVEYSIIPDKQFYSLFLILLIIMILQLVSFVVKYTSSFFGRNKMSGDFK